jgi:hypothetical protein
MVYIASDRLPLRSRRPMLSGLSEVKQGIADNIESTGYLAMFDLVQSELRGHQGLAVFAMFGRLEAGQCDNHLSGTVFFYCSSAPT